MRWLLAVAVPYAGDNCLIWPFGRGVDGYPLVRAGGRMQRANRVVCRLAHGEPPSPKHDAAHSCGRGHDACVTKRHLRWATSAENKADMLIHGTRVRGEAVHNAKLTEAAVREIRALRGKKLQREVAEMFGVTIPHICLVQTGKRWGHVQ